jgi:D-3-phosphoglycerate dehydrogenase
MATHRILVTDPLHPIGKKLLEESGAEVVQLAEEDRPRLPDLLPDFDALVVRSATKVTADLLRAGTRLKVVGRAGIGVDNVDVKTATELGILVVNAPTANLMSATEHTLALLLALARKIPAADASLRSGEWNRKAFVGTELQGKTLGVVGFGRIGQRVAERARAFGMTVVAYDPFLDSAVAYKMDIDMLSLEQLLSRAEVLTLHVPLSDDTRGLIGEAEMARMPKGALLINCARGGVVDETALLEALESGHLAGAALDVFTQEPPKDFTLMRHPQVVATPHIGAQTREAQERIATETARMVLSSLDGSLAVTAVNLPFRPAGTHAEPFLLLGEQLGRLAGKLLGGSAQRVQIDLWGIDDVLRQPVAVAVVKGILMPFLGEGVNYVNAERIAESRGIETVRATHSATADYPHLLGVTLSGEGRSIELAGTVFGDSDPRIVRFGGFPLEFRPAGLLLVLRNQDRPGVVGKIGQLLGEADLNIADIHLARQESDALAVLRLDGEPSSATLERLRELPEVRTVQLVDLGRR